jgi:hypothetical protein
LHQGLRLSRPWLALVLVLFCLPLFVGLRSLELETDEAIYSFAVDRILEVGEWLQPKSSPSETAVFLEKPPLKFWIVAAPIRAGILPHNEFGLRFWDALFGAAAFVYVFAIGTILISPVCGAIAVLVLFVHWPLVFEHGLRTNNMEGALFLAYCGGLYHFVRWMTPGVPHRRAHSVTVGLFFVLGFLTKFVAIIFLPAIAGGAALLLRTERRRLVAGWKEWLGVAALALALVAPWFIYAQLQFGSELWHTMLAEHVYARFTTALNPAHIQPWNFYFTNMFREFAIAGIDWIVPIAVAVLVVQAIARRSLPLLTVALWMIPLGLISFGSSKLYHYAYPFLPPIALACGYMAGLIMQLGPPLLRNAAEGLERIIGRGLPMLASIAERRWLRIAAGAVIAAGAGLAIGALLFGSVRLGVGRLTVFKSSGVFRPVAAIFVAGLLMRRGVAVSGLIVALVVASYLPIELYKQTLPKLVEEKHPIRDASECVIEVQRSNPALAPGLLVDTDSSMWHPIYYYFRRIRPWTRQESPAPAQLERTLHDSASLRPSLVNDVRYREYLSGPEGAKLAGTVSPPMISLFEYVLLLPGPYAVCSPEASLHASASPKP